MKAYPALEIRAADPDRLYAAIDDFSPTALEERTDSIRVFFSTTSARDEAQSALAPAFDVAPIDVSDEDWARRSQEDLQPVTVGRVTILPDSRSNPESRIPNPVSIVIRPSMGFGTGHHATTRLCLAALQMLDLADTFVLDVGTGSGVLAIAADRLGARRALGIDHDADAVQAACENLCLNPAAKRVSFVVDDLRTAVLPQADVVTANLTGALLVQAAAELLGAVTADGTLIVSGLLSSERDEVVRTLTGPASAFAATPLRRDRSAFAATPLRRDKNAGHYVQRARIVWEREEDGWVGLAVKKS